MSIPVLDWPALRDELARTLTITESSPRRLAATTPDGCPVRIAITRGVVDWLVVEAWICRQADVDPVGILARNAELVFATVVLRDDDCWLRVAVPLDSVEVADPARVIALAISAARSMSPVRVAPMVGARDAFSHYVD